MKNIFEEYESEVRSYCRTFPKEFKSSKGAIIEDIEGNWKIVYYKDLFPQEV